MPDTMSFMAVDSRFTNISKRILATFLGFFIGIFRVSVLESGRFFGRARQRPSRIPSGYYFVRTICRNAKTSRSSFGRNDPSTVPIVARMSQTPGHCGVFDRLIIVIIGCERFACWPTSCTAATSCDGHRFRTHPRALPLGHTRL